MDRLWFYARKGSSQQGPVAESEIQALIRRGEILREDLVWSEGMAEWQRADAQAGWFPASADAVSPAVTAAPAPAPAPATTDTEVEVIPDGLLGWMTFNGVMNIVMGVLSILSCFGLPTGVLMLIGGIGLTGARTALENVSSLPPDLAPFFKKFRTFLVMTGIMYILSIVLMIVMMLFYIGVFAFAMSAAGTGLK